MPESCPAIWRDISSLEEWADRNLLKLSKIKWKVLHLGMNNLVHQYMLGADRLESSCEKKDLVDTKSNMNQQHTPMAKKAQSILHFLRKDIAYRSREVILSAQHWCGHTWNFVCSFGACFLIKKRLRQTGLFSLEKRKLEWILSMCVNI